jgi:DNA-binding CsgD family transcriptional regulator
MDKTFMQAGGGPVGQYLREVRPTVQTFARCDLDRARLIADSIARGISTVDDTVRIADQAILLGLTTTSTGDYATGAQLLTRGLIAATLSAWQLSELAADAAGKHDTSIAHARRSAAELQLSLLPGRVGLAVAALRSAPDGEAAQALLRSTLFAFVVGSGVARVVLGTVGQRSWFGALAAAFERDKVAAGASPAHGNSTPRLAYSARGAESRRMSSRTERRPALSDREGEVLGHIVAGLTTGEIAFRLGVKSTTVSTLVGRIFNKLGVNNRPAAVAAALRHGLCTVSDEGPA